MSTLFLIFLLFCAFSAGAIFGYWFLFMEIKQEFYVATKENGTLLQGPFLTVDGAQLYARQCFKPETWRIVKKNMYSTSEVI